MKRAILLILDSVGIGNGRFAERYGDLGSDTLGHIVERCANGEADQVGKRKGPLQLPNLSRMGLQKAVEESRGAPLTKSLGYNGELHGAYGYAQEISKGKDTSSGHWEIAGVPIDFEWGYFENKIPCFPKELVNNFILEAKVPGVLGEKHASGTQIISELGDEHVKTGKPIIYTSADSVFQIAAHEEAFGLQRLYDVCKIARKLVDQYKIARVIARPFVGKNGNYTRTFNRHDYSVLPPEPTLLDKLKESGRGVIGIGKIPDIFAHQGITKEVKAGGLQELFDATLNEIKIAPDQTLIFTNFVDYDMLYGHRRDIAGYAAALEYFDKRLPELEQIVVPGDLVIITADHGCDPTWKGTDHTRENIPILMFGTNIKSVNLGRRQSFSDIGQTVAKYLEISPLKYGVPCEIRNRLQTRDHRLQTRDYRPQTTDQRLQTKKKRI